MLDCALIWLIGVCVVIRLNTVCSNGGNKYLFGYPFSLQFNSMKQLQRTNRYCQVAAKQDRHYKLAISMTNMDVSLKASHTVILLKFEGSIG